MYKEYEWDWTNIDPFSRNELRSLGIDEIDDTIEKMKYLADIQNPKELNEQLGKEQCPFLTKVFSHLRANVISWLPFQKSDSVLIVGSDYGVFVNAIAPYVKDVMNVEYIYLRAVTNYYRNRQYDNIEIIMTDTEFVPAFKNKFDYVIFATPLTLENEKNVEDTSFYKNLQKLKCFTKKHSKIIFMSGNRFGMKYWAGCKDAVTYGYFSGIEGYGKHKEKGMPSRNSMHALISALDYSYNKIYYPYPDHIYATSIFSDDVLPGNGDLKKMLLVGRKEWSSLMKLKLLII